MKILLFFFLISSFNSISQVNTSDLISRNPDFFNPNGGLNFMSNNSNGLNISGSQYLFEKWDDQYIIKTMNGGIYNINNLNYNLSTKKILYKFSEDSIFELRINLIDNIKVKNKKFIFFNNELMQEICLNPTFKLFKQFNLKIREAFINPMTKTETMPTKYIVFESYLLVDNLQNSKKFKLCRKDILSLFGDKVDVMKAFIKEKNLSYEIENEVIQILNYYNSL